MKFADFFHQLREQYLTTNVRNTKDRLAIQINLTGTKEETGTFYVEIKDGHLAIEPYDYYDRDASITISMSDFQQVLSHKLDPLSAYTTGRMIVFGNVEKVMELRSVFY
jgi:putative sterol carrier protein